MSFAIPTICSVGTTTPRAPATKGFMFSISDRSIRPSSSTFISPPPRFVDTGLPPDCLSAAPGAATTIPAALTLVDPGTILCVACCVAGITVCCGVGLFVGCCVGCCVVVVFVVVVFATGFFVVEGSVFFVAFEVYFLRLIALVPVRLRILVTSS